MPQAKRLPGNKKTIVKKFKKEFLGYFNIFPNNKKAREISRAYELKTWNSKLTGLSPAPRPWCTWR
jgi:hypothetical protein